MRYSIPVKGTSDGQKLLKSVTKTGHLYLPILMHTELFVGSATCTCLCLHHHVGLAFPQWGSGVNSHTSDIPPSLNVGSIILEASYKVRQACEKTHEMRQISTSTHSYNTYYNTPRNDGGGARISELLSDCVQSTDRINHSCPDNAISRQW